MWLFVPPVTVHTQSHRTQWQPLSWNPKLASQENRAKGLEKCTADPAEPPSLSSRHRSLALAPSGETSCLIATGWHCSWLPDHLHTHTHTFFYCFVVCIQRSRGACGAFSPSLHHLPPSLHVRLLRVAWVTFRPLILSSPWESSEWFTWVQWSLCIDVTYFKLKAFANREREDY